MRPFGCPVTILNTLDSLGKFEGKVNEGFLVGYSVNSKSFRVFNSRTRIVQETLHVNFLENKPNVAGFQDKFDAEKVGEEIDQQYVLFPMWSSGSTNPQNNDEDVAFDGKELYFDAKKPDSNNEVNAFGSIVPTVGQNSLNNTNPFSAAGPSNTTAIPTYGQSSFKDASQATDDPDMPELEDITYSDDENVVGAEADFNNLETSITVSPIPTIRIHKDHPEKGIDYEEVFAPVARIEAIRLVLAYASFMEFMVYQMDVKKKPLLKDYDGEDVDVHTYMSMIGSLMYLTSSRPDIMFECKKKTVVATSSTEAKYVAAASCCAQVL
nr:retrovirus-related Pol polyprotein from transposon TNT 1-94 [Tanacetum cinerariifolium]